MQHRWREDFFNQRQRQVQRLHQNIRKFQNAPDQEQLYSKTIRDVKHNVQVRYNYCETNHTYRFPRPEPITPSNEQSVASLESTYNLFQQNSIGKQFDQVLFPSRNKLQKFPDFSKKIRISLERGKSKSRQRPVTPVQKCIVKQLAPRIHTQLSKDKSRLAEVKSNSKVRCVSKQGKQIKEQKKTEQSLQRTLRLQEWSSTKRKLQNYSSGRCAASRRSPIGHQSLTKKKNSSSERQM